MLQTHSDKPYKCDRCQASFRYKGNLASHKTVHTGMALPPHTRDHQGHSGQEGEWIPEKAVWGFGTRWGEAGSRPRPDLSEGPGPVAPLLSDLSMPCILCLSSEMALSCFSAYAGVRSVNPTLKEEKLRLREAK